MNTFSTDYFNNPLRMRYLMTDDLRALVMELPAGSRILDLGCGDMLLLSEIAVLRPDLKLHGVDIGDISTAPRGIRFTNADVTTFVVDEKCDLILAIDILEHLPQPEKLVKTALSSIVDGGRFYTTVPSVTKLLLFGDENFYSDYTHIRPFNCKSMVRLLQDHGFSVISAAAVGHSKKSIPKLVYSIIRSILTWNYNYLNVSIKMFVGTSIQTISCKKN